MPKHAPTFKAILRQEKQAMRSPLLKPTSQGYRFKWHYINLVQYFAQAYAFVDFCAQVFYQVPIVPEFWWAEIVGLRKSYFVPLFSY
jgi:hypothetical protein